MEKTFQTLNELESSGLIARYAVGGAIAAYFYAEAVVTEDLDIFVTVEHPPSGVLTLTPIYEFLKARGAAEDREHLVIAGTLVQIIPAYDALTEEAVAQAVPRKVGQAPTRVMRPEHLIAIALKTGRAKDHARIAQLLEQAPVADDQLKDIVQRHQLTERWEKFRAK
jgi:hypothetical protein